VLEGFVPVALGLVVLWALLGLQSRGRWNRGAASAAEPRAMALPAQEPPFDRWQTAKGLVVAGALIMVFLFTNLPRDVAALTGAGFLLMSRKLHSNSTLGLIDWELLILFIGLFVVNHALERTGGTEQGGQAVPARGFGRPQRARFSGAILVRSTVVPNVPAVMLLLPAATQPFSGPMLALVSTLAGNLFIVGSI